MGGNSTGYALMIIGGAIGIPALLGKLPLWTLLIAFPMVLYGSSISGGLGPAGASTS